MGRRWWMGVVALVVGVTAVAGCPDPSQCDAHGAAPATSAPATAPTTTAETPHPAVPHTTEEPAPDLSAAVARAVEAAAGVDLGLAVIDLDTGAAAGHNADTPYRSASLSKLLVAEDMLTSGDVSDADRGLLERALSLSDDNAMNALWTSHDGMGAITRVAAEAGLTNTRAPDDPSQWGEVEMSANDLAKLYDHILTELPDDDRDFIVGKLSTASPIAEDGFDQAYGLLAPGVDGYGKQGWMWYLPADFYLHSTGVVGNRFAVAVLSIQTGVGERTAKDRLTGVTSALLAVLTSTG